MADKQLYVDLALKDQSFAKQIKSAETSIKSLKAETKAVESEFGSFGNSLEGLGKKLEQQNKMYDALKIKLIAQQEAYKQTEETLGKLTNKYQEQGKKVAELKQKLQQAESTYGKNSEEAKKLREELNNAQSAYDKTGSSIVNANNRLKTMEASINTTQTDINNLGREIEETQSEIDNFGEGDNLNDLSNNIDEASDSSLEFNERLSNMGHNLSEVGDKASEFGKKIVSSFGGILKDTYEAANALSETQRKSEVVFGDMVNDVRDYAVANEKYLGLGSGTIEGLASNFSDLTQGIGMAKESSVDMGKSAVELSVKLGNWGNTDASTAMEDIQSAVMGSTKAVQKYGVKLNDNVLAQTAMNMGLGENFSALTEAEKAQVRYQAIMDASTNAITYFDEGNRNASFYMNEMSEMTGNLKENLGAILLPTVTEVVKKIAELTTKISDWSAKNPQLMKTIVVIGTVIAGLGAGLVVFGTLASVIGSAISGFTALSGIMGGFGIALAPVILTVGAVLGAIVLLVGAIKSNFDGIKSACENLKTSFQNNFGGIQGSFQEVWEMCQSIYDTVVQPLFSTIGILIEGVINFIAGIMPGLSTAFQVAFDIVKTIWDSVGQPVAQFIMDIFSSVVDWFVANMPTIARIFNEVMTVLKSIWNSIGKPLFNIIKTIIGATIDALKPIISSLGTAFSNAFKAIVSIWDNVLKPVITVISSVIGSMVSSVSGFINTFKTTITNGMKAVLSPIQGVIDKISSLLSFIGNAGKKVGSFLQSINPFSRSAITYSLASDYSAMPMTASYSLDNVALSGSYYTRSTPLSTVASDFVKMSNNIPTVRDTSSGLNKSLENSLTGIINSFKEEINEMKSSNDSMMKLLVNTLSAMTNAMQDYVLQDAIQLENKIDNNIYLNAKDVAMATAPYNEKAQYSYNKLRTR